MPVFQSGGAGATPAWGTYGVSTGVRFQRGLISRMAHKAYVGSNPTAPTCFIEWTSLEWSRVSETRERGFKSLLGDWLRAVREPGFIYQSGRLGHVGSNPTCSTERGQVRKPAKRSVREADVCGFDSHPNYFAGRARQRLAAKQRSRGPAAKTAGSHPVNDGSSPSGITLGPWSNGTTLASHAGNRGSTPRRSTSFPYTSEVS